MALERIEVNPPGGAEPVGTVIWMHGLGASGHDFEPIVPFLHLPQVRFVFPHAPVIPVTLNGGMSMPAWYDILTLDREPGKNREPEISVREGARHVEALLAAEIDAGMPADRIVLAGFSQGGAMALHVGARFPVSLRGIMVLSGYLLLPDIFAEEAHVGNSETAALFCHGKDDPMVPCIGGRHAYETMRDQASSRAIEWHEFPMGHEVCPQEIGVIARWLGERFADSL